MTKYGPIPTRFWTNGKTDGVKSVSNSGADPPTARRPDTPKRFAFRLAKPG